MPDYDAIIVGGGHNGLVCAAYLARAGLTVSVVERRPLVGGACVTEELFPGYRFSTCSYLCYLLQSKIIADLELRKHGFEVFHINPWRFCPFPGGDHLLIWDDDARTQAELARFSKRDAASYPKWNAFWRRAAGIMHRYFLRPPPAIEEIIADLSGTGHEVFFRELLESSMTDVVTHFFESEQARAAFIHAHDCGDPSARGSAWAYAYIKCTMFSRPEDVGLVKGGMGGIANALANSAKASGVAIRTEASVESILVENGAAIGIRMKDGSELRSRIVVSNADPKRTLLRLLDGSALSASTAADVRKLSTRAAYFKFHAALTGAPDFSPFFERGETRFEPSFLGEVKICPSLTYFRDAWLDAVNGEPARQPVMEVQIPSAYDPTVAPPGQHVMSIWALYAPVRPRSGSWDTRRRECGERLIDTLRTYAPNLRDIIADWSLYTPADIEERVAMTDGNIRHLDMIPDQMLARRPLPGWNGYRTPVRQLYLCGAGTHPGGEVTGAPGHNAAAMILDDLGRT